MKILLIIPAALFSLQLLAQDCAVDKEELKGTYTGDCKKGKANGRGKATGIDSYEGEFRSGLPYGKGTYTWQNGNQFIGQFVKGLKEGKGKLVYKRTDKDSIIEGYWKKDIYVGLYENPWRIIYQSKLVTEIGVEYKKDNFNKISFVIGNTSGGAQTIEGNELPKLKVDEVHPSTGSYGRLFINENNGRKTESVIEDVHYPFRFKAMIGTEEIEMEFLEAGSYTVKVQINY